MLTPQQAASRAQVSRGTIMNAIKDRHLVARRDNRNRSQLDPAVYKSVERNACLKIDLQVLPLCLLLYLLSFLDRTNVSQSMMDRGETRPDGSIKDPGIMTSLDMTPHQYATAL